MHPDPYLPNSEVWARRSRREASATERPARRGERRDSKENTSFLPFVTDNSERKERSDGRCGYEEKERGRETCE